MGASALQSQGVQPMSSTMIIVATFIFFLVVFIGIGVLSARKMTTTSEDYLVASRSVNPWLVALSAVSTNNSGYMLSRRTIPRSLRRFFHQSQDLTLRIDVVKSGFSGNLRSDRRTKTGNTNQLCFVKGNWFVESGVADC